MSGRRRVIGMGFEMVILRDGAMGGGMSGVGVG